MAISETAGIYNDSNHEGYTNIVGAAGMIGWTLCSLSELHRKVDDLSSGKREGIQRDMSSLRKEMGDLRREMGQFRDRYSN